MHRAGDQQSRQFDPRLRQNYRTPRPSLLNQPLIAPIIDLTAPPLIRILLLEIKKILIRIIRHKTVRVLYEADIPQVQRIIFVSQIYSNILINSASSKILKSIVKIIFTICLASVILGLNR